MGKKATCKGCDQERAIIGRGLCGTCYAKARKAEGTIPGKRETKPPKAETKPPVIETDGQLAEKILADWNEKIRELRDIRTIVIALENYGVIIALPEVIV